MRYLINAGNACVLGQRRLPCYDVLLHRVCHCCSIFQPRFTPSPFIFERYSRRLERTRATYADKRQEKWTYKEMIRGLINSNFSSTNIHTIAYIKRCKWRNIKDRTRDITFFFFFFSCDIQRFLRIRISERRHVKYLNRGKYTFRVKELSRWIFCGHEGVKEVSRMQIDERFPYRSRARNDFTLLIGSSIFLEGTQRHRVHRRSSVRRRSVAINYLIRPSFFSPDTAGCRRLHG